MFDEVYRHVARDFVDTLADSTIYACGGRTRSTSCTIRTARICRRSLLAALSERTTGRYAGVGAQIDLRDGWSSSSHRCPAGRAGRRHPDWRSIHAQELHVAREHEQASAALRSANRPAPRRAPRDRGSRRARTPPPARRAAPRAPAPSRRRRSRPRRRPAPRARAPCRAAPAGSCPCPTRALRSVAAGSRAARYLRRTDPARRQHQPGGVLDLPRRHRRSGVCAAGIDGGGSGSGDRPCGAGGIFPQPRLDRG